uniref:TonB-dependent receptor n=1 Tax=Roseivirga sp. TaxID=1964215 RepID=UPI004048104B
MAFSAMGQGLGTIQGYVYDAQDRLPLAGATIQLTDSNLGAVTDGNGYFKIENVPTQTYNIEARFVGFRSEIKYNLIVRSVGNADLIFYLKEEASDLDEVVVTSSPFPAKIESPNSIQNLSREEIATYPGGNNDIAKVVQSLPGVSGSVGFRNDVIIRGGAPSENVYYLDGVEIPNINHFATQGSAGGPVGLLNVSFIEDVTLSTSAFAARYDNALSGVLQFNQRNGNSRNRNLNFRLGASEAALTFEGPLTLPKENEQAKTTFIVSARRSYLQFLFKLIGLPFLPDYWDYQYKINHKIDDKNEINLIGIGSIDDFKVNTPDDITEEQQATLDQIAIIKQWTSTVGISWKHKLESGFVRTTVSGNVLDNEFTRYQDNQAQQGVLFSNKSREAEQKVEVRSHKFLQ